MRIDSRRVEELRVKLRNLGKERRQLVGKNGVVLEKLRQMEQDRSLLLTSIFFD